MANLQFFRENFDKFLEDAKVQVESLTNDFKDIPDGIQETLAQFQQELPHLGEKFATASRNVLNGTLVNKDFRPALQEIVSHLEKEVDNIYVRIKSAIEKAK